MTPKNLALIGCGMLAAGVFTPIVSAPIIGNLNYFQNGKGDGVVILALAGISLYLILNEKLKALFWSGSSALAVQAFTFLNFHSKMNEMQDQMNQELAGNPFRGIADAAMGSVQIQWGWAVLVAGAICLLVASHEAGKTVPSNAATKG